MREQLHANQQTWGSRGGAMGFVWFFCVGTLALVPAREQRRVDARQARHSTAG